MKLKLLYVVSFCFVTMLAVVFFNISLMTDVSLMEPYESKFYQSNDPIYLISYSDGPKYFIQNQSVQTISAQNKGIDFFLNYRRKHIDKQFYEDNKEILENPTGAGLWLWKPYFILKTMENAPENSIIIYADSGAVVKHPVDQLIAQMQDKDIMLFHDVNVTKDKHPVPYLTKLNLQNEMLMEKPTPAIWATVVFIKNTRKSRSLMREWLDYSTIPGVLSYTDQHEKMMHDQSVLEIVYKLNSDDIKLYPLNLIFSRVFTWYHRKDINENESFNGSFYVRGPIKKIARFFLELKIMHKYRDLVLKSKRYDLESGELII